MSTVIVDWNDEQRRTSSYAVLGAAVVIALVAVALWWFVAATPAWLYWALVGVLVLVLVFMALLLVLKPKAAQAAAESAPARQEAAAPVAQAPAPAAFEPRVLTLRCGDCGTIFEVTDTGERPLYHTCPGCGAEGALRDPVEAAPVAAAPEAVPEPAPQWAPEPAPEPTPPPAPAAPAPALAPAPAVKKIKLRCGGCKEVFAIEDTGERPLKRACPNCGRMGMIR